MAAVDWKRLRAEYGIIFKDFVLDTSEASAKVERFRGALEELAAAWQALPTAIQFGIGDVEIVLQADPEDGVYDVS